MSKKRRYDEWMLVSLLLLALFVVFLIIPLLGLLKQSVYNGDGQLTFANFERFFTYTNGYYLKPLGNSVKVTLATTIVTSVARSARFPITSMTMSTTLTVTSAARSARLSSPPLRISSTAMLTVTAKSPCWIPLCCLSTCPNGM